MVSNTHEDGQIVVSKEITPVCPPKNTYGSNKYHLAESSSSKTFDLSKNMEQIKSSVHPNDDNVKNKGVMAENFSSVDENLFSAEDIVHGDNNELLSIEEEVVICDTCGDLGCENKLVICDICGVGAEHTYCMVIKLEDVPIEWSCYECVEEAYSITKKEKPFIDFFEMAEKASLQKQNKLNTQKSFETMGVDFNTYHNLNLNMYRKIDLNVDPNLDLNADPNLDLSLDLNLDPNLDLNVVHNLDLMLDCGLSYRSSSTSNSQTYKRMRVSMNPLLEERSFEEKEKCVKRPCLDTRLFS